ncbi:hypothetical protein ZOD2009_18360 [Haladaptatus paucihalophilus DX253]|nr:hypothetical protein [Haladaptatus paucihalophilus]EFW90684.1 hypothetical protein ZOD2009_18360 [Haladaptatus paucihalophilus DX253]
MEPLFTCWQDGVTVSRIGAKNQIRIAGQIESGGRSCMETVLETVGIDEDTDTLLVVVADRQQQGASSCTLEEALVRYDATMTLKDAVPNRVRVRHRSELGRGGSHDQFDETVVFETGEGETRTVSC